LNLPMGLSIGDKFKLLRKHEGLSQRALCEMAGIQQGTLANVENGRNKGMSTEILGKIVSHPRFFPYAMWLLVDELSEEQALGTLNYLQELQGQNGQPEPE